MFVLFIFRPTSQNNFVSETKPSIILEDMSRSRRMKRTNFPTRLLTAARRIKILQFKNLCKKRTETNNGVGGSDTWINSLLGFMNEGRKLTVENVNGWIRMHPWITADDSCGFNVADTSNHVNVVPNYMDQIENQIFCGHGESSRIQIEWSEDDEDSQASSQLSQLSGTSQSTGQPHDITTQQIETYTFPIGWTQQPQSLHERQHQHHGNLQSYSNANNSDSVGVIYLTTQVPPNDQGNGNHSQLEEIENANTNNLYSEEVLEGLTEVMKHLAKLDKYYTKLECVRTLLFPLEKMVNTVERNIRKCTMPKQHKDALAAKTLQLRRQIKMENLNGHPNQPSSVAVELGDQMGEDFHVDEIDIGDQ